jgi:hypothetical protein
VKLHFKKLLISSLLVAALVLLLTPAVQQAKDASPLMQLQIAIKLIQQEAEEMNSQVQSIEEPSDKDIPSVKLRASTHTKNIEDGAKQANVIIQGLRTKGIRYTDQWASYSSVIAALIATIGTISSLVLSWRKDVRETRAAVPAPVEHRKIVLP